MKKIFLPLMVLMLLLTGCRKKEVEVVPTYDYDFTNYLSVQTSGPNGYAKLYVEIKDFDSTNFKNEDDYIFVKKLMPELLNNLYVTKQENLVNGDVIEIGISGNYVYQGNVSINLGAHTLNISGLPDPVELDLFDSNNVVFYGLEGTNKVYTLFPKGSKIPSEIRESLYYNISIDEEEVHANRTVVSAAAEIDPFVLEKDDKYVDATSYFIANGFIPKMSKEFTLKTIVNESALANAKEDYVKKELDTKIGSLGDIGGFNFVTTLSVQKIDDAPYRYYVIAKYNLEDKDSFARYRVDMAYINGHIEFIEMTRDGSAKEDDLYKGCTEIFKFDENSAPETITVDVGEIATPEVSTENTAENINENVESSQDNQN